MSAGEPIPEARAADEAQPGSLSQRLQEFANDSGSDRVSVADLLQALQDRALGALLLIFALPNVLPTLPGTSALLGAPLIFLSAQLCLGMRPWLPGFIGRRSVSRGQFVALMARAVPWLARAERLLRPRFGVLTRQPAQYGLGLICLLLSIVIFLPIPLGNMLPALAICLVALGLLGRDGLCVLLGCFTALIAVAMVWGVLYALIKAVVFLVVEAIGRQ